MSQPTYQPDYEGSHALLIGVDRYQQFSPLKTAVKGVRELAEVLHSELGFPRENMSILENDEATQRNIRRRMVEPLSRSDIVGPDDRVIVYFAGHGVTVSTASGPQGYIVPVDGEPQYYDTLIAMDELTRTAAEHIHAKHVIFLLDACFSGFATVRLSETTERQYRDYITRPVRQVIAAGTRDQAVSDLWGPGGHSLFTGFLIDGLRGNAPAPGGMLRGFHLAGWLQDQVAQHSRSLQTPQYAALMGSGGGDFIFKVRDEITRQEELPAEVRALLDSPLAEARRAGAETLAHLLTSSQPAVAALARERLADLAQADDSLSVRQAAQQALGRVMDAPEPEPPAPQRVEAAMPETAVADPGTQAPKPSAAVETTGPVQARPVQVARPVSRPVAGTVREGWFKRHGRAIWASLAIGAANLALLGVVFSLAGPALVVTALVGLANAVLFNLILRRQGAAFVWPLIVWPVIATLSLRFFGGTLGMLIFTVATLIFIWVANSRAR